MIHFGHLLGNKCPRCYQGKVFKYKLGHYNPFKLFLMHEKCSSCKFTYEMETGFFYGSMYVNYGLSIGFSIVWVITLRFLLGLAWEVAVISNAVMLVLLTPITFRISRLLWLYLFGKKKN